MYNYRTVVEKAAEWNISSRHIQYLCRNNKIEGAIKRAGSWFIPEHTPSPAKNTKAGDLEFRFVGTKKRIFDSAIKLFMLKGYDHVSLRDIASEIGVRQSTIYNHFESKQQILDTIYDFYCHNYQKERPSLADMEERLKDESLLSIINHIAYDFGEDYLQEVSDITKIIFQRIGIDERAREIGKSLMVDDGIEYVKNVFGKGIETGRFAPFDTQLMAVFINSIRMFMMFNWILDSAPDSMTKLSEAEQELYILGGKFIEEITTPADNSVESDNNVEHEY